MVNWQDPATLLTQAASLQKLALVFAGIYFYDFSLSLPHDWVVINKPYDKPVHLAGNILYLVCRYLVFMSCATSSILVTIYQGVSCSVLVKLYAFSADIGISSASSLLFIRAGIVWKWDRRVVTFLAVFLAAMYACAIQDIVTMTSTYDASLEQCTLSGSVADRPFAVVLLAGDLTLLAFILVGLQKTWKGARGLPLWFALWKQGWLYFAIAIMFEVPLMGFLMLNLNQFMNTLFIVPSVVILGIGATRLHRALSRHGDRTIMLYKPTADAQTQIYRRPTVIANAFELTHIGATSAPATPATVISADDLP